MPTMHFKKEPKTHAPQDHGCGIVALLIAIILLLFNGCNVTDAGPEYYRANMYIDSYQTVENGTLAWCVVVASDHPMPDRVQVEFLEFLLEAFYLQANARTRFGATLTREGEHWMMVSFGDEFQDLYR